MKTVLKVIVNVLVWIVLILALLMTVMVFSSGRNNGIANLMGFIPMTVESDSMKPTFQKNDLIICKEVDDVYKLKEGDVITFWTLIDGQKVKNTHRIVEITELDGDRSFITRGDNNEIDDLVPVMKGDSFQKKMRKRSRSVPSKNTWLLRIRNREKTTRKFPTVRHKSTVRRSIGERYDWIS